MLLHITGWNRQLRHLLHVDVQFILSVSDRYERISIIIKLGSVAHEVCAAITSSLLMVSILSA